MKLRDRARKLFGRDQLCEHTVKATKVDHAVLTDVRKRAGKLDEAIGTPPDIYTNELHQQTLDHAVWERLAEDLWSELYGDDEPSLRDRDQIDPRFHVNRQLADKQARDESFRETRSMTRGHVTESALGLLGALNSLRESYGDELAEHAARQNEIAEAQDTIESLDDKLAELRQQRADADETGEIDDRIRALADRKRMWADQLKKAEAEQARHAGSLIDAARAATAKAAEQASDAIEAVSMLPGSGAGPGKNVSVDQMIEFANRVADSSVLAEVLKMLGRLELSMGAKRRTLRKGGFEELVDIELGNELAAVLPAEKALLTHPVARLDFYRRFHERSLMQYEYQSELELKKGPIIFATDGSGSMSGAPNIFARGLTLAACSIGHREGRNTAAIEFGSRGELREFFFAKDRPFDTAVALDFAEHFYAGGTDINQVLVRARALIEDEEPFHTADLVIVTDGGDVLTDDSYRLRDELVSAGVTIHGLMIAAQPTQYLLTICDKVTAVFDFAGPNNVSDRLAIDLT